MKMMSDTQEATERLAVFERFIRTGEGPNKMIAPPEFEAKLRSLWIDDERRGEPNKEIWANTAATNTLLTDNYVNVVKWLAEEVWSAIQPQNRARFDDYGPTTIHRDPFMNRPYVSFFTSKALKSEVPAPLSGAQP